MTRQPIKKKLPKPKKCKGCGNVFQPERYLQSVCSYQCGLMKAQDDLKKKDKKNWVAEKKVLKEKNKTHKDYLRSLQIIFNKYIRLRDKDLPCVSCGRTTCEEFHAGHYIASTYQYLRFNENNVWRQCSECNTHLRGNSVPYRIELIKRIGLEAVEKLENSRHIIYKHSIPELIAKAAHYKSLIKILEEK